MISKDEPLTALKIDIVSDVICPWCYLGKRRLELALESLSGEVEAIVAWHPFQLEPDAPAEGFDALERLASKFGSKDAVRGAWERLEALGREVGLSYDFQAAKVIPNTLDAHRLLHWAGQEDLGVQNRLSDLLFKANFEEGLDVGRKDVLVRLAAEAGMDGKLVATLLDGDADRDETRAEIANLSRMGVTGVPFFIIENSYAVSGAQPVEAFVNALREIAQMKRAKAN